MTETLKAILLKLRAEIAPMAAQIICPAENTFTRQLALIDAAVELLKDSVNPNKENKHE